MTPGWVNSLPAWASFGVGAGGGFVLFKWMLDWIAGRLDRRSDDISAGTQRLIDGLEKRLATVTERLDRVEEDLKECNRVHSESQAEVVRLKAMMQGMGDARQAIQRIVAADKQSEKEAK